MKVSELQPHFSQFMDAVNIGAQALVNYKEKKLNFQKSRISSPLYIFYKPI